MCICAFVCVHVCVCVCVCIQLIFTIATEKFELISTNTYIHTCIHVYIHTCTHTYTYIYTYTRTHTHTYIHVDKHIIHTYIHTYIRIRKTSRCSFIFVWDHAHAQYNPYSSSQRVATVRLIRQLTKNSTSRSRPR